MLQSQIQKIGISELFVAAETVSERQTSRVSAVPSTPMIPYNILMAVVSCVEHA